MGGEEGGPQRRLFGPLLCHTVSQPSSDPEREHDLGLGLVVNTEQEPTLRYPPWVPNEEAPRGVKELRIFAEGVSQREREESPNQLQDHVAGHTKFNSHNQSPVVHFMGAEAPLVVCAFPIQTLEGEIGQDLGEAHCGVGLDTQALREHACAWSVSAFLLLRRECVCVGERG